MTMRNIETAMVLKLGTVSLRGDISAVDEQDIYRRIAEYSLIAMTAYPFVIVGAVGYLKTTSHSFRENGWLTMSAVLFFIFIPVELYCFYVDWQLIGLQYWGTWPLDEFRKAFLRRVTALGGLSFIGTLCYYTIVGLIIFRPMKLNRKNDT
jgi:hypothetical protein